MFHSTENKPVFLNLLRIKFPVIAILSIGHRLSGVLLFIATPFLIYLFDLSLQGPDGYDEALRLFQLPIVKMCIFVVTWSFVHHFLSGLRFLLIDIDIGVDRKTARGTAWAVAVAEFVIVISIGALIL